MKTTLIQEQDKVIQAAKGNKGEFKAAKARFAKWCAAHKVDFTPALYDALDMVELERAAK